MPPVAGLAMGALGAIGTAKAGFDTVNAATGGMIGNTIGGIINKGPGGGNDPSAAIAANNRAQAVAQKQAYDELIARGQGQFDTGETQFLKEANQAPPEMLAAQQALQNKTSAGYNELQAGLSKGGVRGGQAATQLRRGAGDLQQQLDTMAFQEAQQRQQAKLGYFGNKAQTGQRATLPGQPAPTVLQ